VRGLGRVRAASIVLTVAAVSFVEVEERGLLNALGMQRTEARRGESVENEAKVGGGVCCCGDCGESCWKQDCGETV